MRNGFILIKQRGGFIIGAHVTEVSFSDKAVFVSTGSETPILAASYENREQCLFVTEMCLRSILDEEEYFQFPHKNDVAALMNIPKQHGSKVTSMKVGHGGS